jgi:hypothetical protein
MIMTNLYGNILSNLACGLIGGPGLLSGRNMGPKYAVFEPGQFIQIFMSFQQDLWILPIHHDRQFFLCRH